MAHRSSCCTAFEPQAEHFRYVIPLVQQQYTVYALDLPGMGYSQIVPPGASYDEPALRAAVERLITQLDLQDVTLLGESIGAVLALTAAADLPGRVRRVVASTPTTTAGESPGRACSLDLSSQASSRPARARSSPGSNRNPSCATY